MTTEEYINIFNSKQITGKRGVYKFSMEHNGKSLWTLKYFNKDDNLCFSVGEDLNTVVKEFYNKLINLSNTCMNCEKESDCKCKDKQVYLSGFIIQWKNTK